MHNSGVFLSLTCPVPSTSPSPCRNITRQSPPMPLSEFERHFTLPVMHKCTLHIARAILVYPSTVTRNTRPHRLLRPPPSALRPPPSAAALRPAGVYRCGRFVAAAATLTQPGTSYDTGTRSCLWPPQPAETTSGGAPGAAVSVVLAASSHKPASSLTTGSKSLLLTGPRRRGRPRSPRRRRRRRLRRHRNRCRERGGGGAAGTGSVTRQCWGGCLQMK